MTLNWMMVNEGFDISWTWEDALSWPGPLDLKITDINERQMLNLSHVSRSHQLSSMRCCHYFLPTSFLERLSQLTNTFGKASNYQTVTSSMYDSICSHFMLFPQQFIKIHQIIHQLAAEHWRQAHCWGEGTFGSFFGGSGNQEKQTITMTTMNK